MRESGDCSGAGRRRGRRLEKRKTSSLPSPIPPRAPFMWRANRADLWVDRHARRGELGLRCVSRHRRGAGSRRETIVRRVQRAHVPAGLCSRARHGRGAAKWLQAEDGTGTQAIVCVRHRAVRTERPDAAGWSARQRAAPSEVHGHAYVLWVAS